jgi:hypothetical protein
METVPRQSKTQNTRKIKKQKPKHNIGDIIKIKRLPHIYIKNGLGIIIKKSNTHIPMYLVVFAGLKHDIWVLEDEIENVIYNTKTRNTNR